jgi:hypothetical protein
MTFDMTPWPWESAHHEFFAYGGRHKKNVGIHSSSGIGTHDLNFRLVEDIIARMTTVTGPQINQNIRGYILFPWSERTKGLETLC